VCTIDMQTWLDKFFSGNGVPRPNVRLKTLADIITYATASPAGISVDFHPMCWRRPNRKTCRGALEIELMTENDEIHWTCPVCGDKGTINGWQGELWDMTNTQPEACIILQ
jgi:hypothetical protein